MQTKAKVDTGKQMTPVVALNRSCFEGLLGSSLGLAGGPNGAASVSGTARCSLRCLAITVHLPRGRQARGPSRDKTTSCSKTQKANSWLLSLRVLRCLPWFVTPRLCYSKSCHGSVIHTSYFYLLAASSQTELNSQRVDSHRSILHSQAS